jgi:hypothetical protein
LASTVTTELPSFGDALVAKEGPLHTGACALRDARPDRDRPAVSPRHPAL